MRGRQFAAVAAATRTRVDLGLRYTDPPASDRLRPAKGFAQATHVTSLLTVAEVDAGIGALARLAYDQNP